MRCGDRPSAAELFGVRDPARHGRDRLLDVAIDLFYAHGFNAVGIDQIVAAAGVTKTTFYKHFGSKDELMVEAVKRRDDWEMAAWERAVIEVAGRHPRNQLLGFFDVLDIWFNDADFHGCLFINTAAEFPNPHDPVHQAAAAHKRRNRDVFCELADAAGFHPADAFADEFTLLLEGTLILRQVHGRNDAARVARPAVEALMQRYSDSARSSAGQS